MALLMLLHPAAVWGSTVQQHYRCDGDPLVATIQPGAVDATGLNLQQEGTRPGDVVLLEWRGISLQLPRTNIAGVPSFSDGRWWWQVIDPDHPDFAQRRGKVEQYSCQPNQSARP